MPLSPNISLIFDVIIIFLLSMTIYYAFYLSRIFTNLKRDKALIERLVQELAKLTDKTEKTVANLRENILDKGAALDSSIRQAQHLTEELNIILSSKDNLQTTQGQYNQYNTHSPVNASPTSMNTSSENKKAQTAKSKKVKAKPAATKSRKNSQDMLKDMAKETPGNISEEERAKMILAALGKEE